MSTTHVLDALVRLEGRAVAVLPPDDVAHEAELIAARWWTSRGDPEPDRRVPLVQELRRWCVVASGRHAARWGQLQRMILPLDAREAARWAGALDRAQGALTTYAQEAPTWPSVQSFTGAYPAAIYTVSTPETCHGGGQGQGHGMIGDAIR